MTLTASPAADPLAYLEPRAIAMNAKTAATVAEATRGKAAVIEAKWDGWRVLAQVAEEGVRLYSRTGNRYEAAVPEIAAEIADRFPVGTWLDGEIVALAESHGIWANDWGVAQSVMSSGRPHPERHRVTYTVFDLLAHGGLDARSLPFKTRRTLLEQAFSAGDFDRLMLTPTMEATEASHETNLALGYEGSMVKLLDAPYRSGARGPAWRKLKPQATSDVVVTGFKPGENGFAGMVGAIEFGQYRDGQLVARGRCSGMTMAQREAMTANPEAWIGVAIEIKHMGCLGDSDAYRHPQFNRRREDKLATDCTWD